MLLILFEGTTARIIVRKVALDMSVFAVPYYTTFYISLNFLAGGHPQQTVSELKQKLLPTILTTSAFWLPAQAVNFRCVGHINERRHGVLLQVCGS